MATFDLCCAGFKAILVLETLDAAGLRPRAIYSYDQPDDRSRAYQRVEELCARWDAPLITTRRPKLSADADLVFFVGWQYLLDDLPPGSVVVHDSILPELRGFAPTVTALLAGKPEIGVTAFSPRQGDLDAGPIFAQSRTAISYPIKIADALAIQSRLIAEVIASLVEARGRGPLPMQPQNLARASYSLWRDQSDYFIDWRRTAAEVQRHVDAVGYPYAGAKAVWGETLVTVDGVTLVRDLPFALRDPGKLWAYDEQHRPIVVCGQGCVRIDAARGEDGEPFKFDRLRRRFLTADTAWRLPWLTEGRGPASPRP